jgi:hypothetical protein
MITAEKLLASEQGLCSMELDLKPVLEIFIILYREHLLASGVLRYIVCRQPQVRQKLPTTAELHILIFGIIIFNIVE